MHSKALSSILSVTSSLERLEATWMVLLNVSECSSQKAPAAVVAIRLKSLEVHLKLHIQSACAAFECAGRPWNQ